MKRTLHMAITIEYARHWIGQWEREGKPQELLRLGNRNTSYAEALTYLADLEADGYECIPSCDDVDEKGRCQGHK